MRLCAPVSACLRARVRARMRVRGRTGAPVYDSQRPCQTSPPQNGRALIERCKRTLCKYHASSKARETNKHPSNTQTSDKLTFMRRQPGSTHTVARCASMLSRLRKPWLRSLLLSRGAPASALKKHFLTCSHLDKRQCSAVFTLAVHS